MAPQPIAPLACAPTTHGSAVDVAQALVREGRIRSALDLLGRAVRDLDDDPAPDAVVRARALGLLVDCYLARGDLGSAVSLSDQLARLGDVPEAHHARAELAAAAGESDLAVERYQAVAESGADDLELPWRAGAALAMLRLGHRAQALDLARTHHATALVRGTGYDVALALRVLAATDPDGQVPSLRRALALLEDSTAARLRAQVQTDLAGLLLLAGRGGDALPLLRAAEAYAAREDLWPLQSRVRRLVERLGEEPRRLESEAFVVLTNAERRVALLVLEGLTNRQVAEQLAVSVKAVEGHLSKVYRKLGLASRTALLASFSSPD